MTYAIFTFFSAEVIPDLANRSPLQLAPVSKELYFFFNWVIVFRDQDLHVWNAHCCWGVITSGPFQQTKLGNICIYTRTYTHICFLNISLYTRIHIHMYMYTYIHIYLYIFVFVLKTWICTDTSDSSARSWNKHTFLISWDLTAFWYPQTCFVDFVEVS